MNNPLKINHPPYKRTYKEKDKISCVQHHKGPKQVCAKKSMCKKGWGREFAVFLILNYIFLQSDLRTRSSSLSSTESGRSHPQKGRLSSTTRYSSPLSSSPSLSPSAFVAAEVKRKTVSFASPSASSSQGTFLELSAI